MIFKRYKRSKNTITIADQILDNQLYVHRMWPAVQIEDELTWKEDPFNDKSWCLYLHSLDMVCHLLNAYELAKNTEYLRKAKQIIESWVKTNTPTKFKRLSPYAWNDHSVANRAINMLYFWSIYQESELCEDHFLKLITDSLMRHGDFLYDDRNHTFENNHGIFQDRSLLALSVLLPEHEQSTEWFNKACERLLWHLEKDVSENGVHLEHSAEYHIIVLKLFSEIRIFLEKNGRPIPVLSDAICKMEKYLAYLIKPDRRVPMTGDSGPVGISFLEKENISSQELLYVFTRGKEGKKPQEDIVYSKEGVALLRNGWDIEEQLYFMFTAAFHSKVHKHADDLSILLSIGDTDVFVDSGKYNFQEKDRFRKYFRSALAHNTITINNKTYDIHKKNIGKAMITGYYLSHDWSAVSGVHTLYSDVEVKRTIIFLKIVGSIIIHDEIVSQSRNLYSQVFNIDNQIELLVNTKQKVALKNKEKKIKLELLQVGEVDNYRYSHGNLDPIAGWKSSSVNQKEPIHHLVFELLGNNAEFRTIINLNLDSGILNFSKEKGSNIYSITSKNNETFQIAKKW